MAKAKNTINHIGGRSERDAQTRFAASQAFSAVQQGAKKGGASDSKARRAAYHVALEITLGGAVTTSVIVAAARWAGIW
jgi:glycerol-3-phosphate O-acyltransferase